eukprot:CAMPEP_0178968780 /NCGR_PEP_ID=MMETSP0789-20121207/18459_1 /TAXON_ID=3005 /ORGANISM="Rhizosolenia setigera, Strain CCMP 1694" /LENGTH=371 /DNA_ID=CAMNT_0020654777 /DNA_START=101 /DNA_END=1216 /DNA_ORIENTATION=-
MGAANIARKILLAIQNQVSNCEIVAIASRSQSKANHLLENYVCSNSDGSKVKAFSGENAYQLLIDEEEVDAVYIPLPVFVKKSWIMKALKAKKHVLCEKPVAMTASDYHEMLAEAKLNKCYIMDGTMFVHNNRTSLMLEYLSEKKVFGDVTRINVEFTFRGDENFHTKNIRTNKEGDPQGCIGDLGWYCIRFALCVFYEKRAVSAQVTNFKLNEEGVPIDCTCLVFFQSDKNGDNKDNHNSSNSEDDYVLSFHCSFLHPLNQRVSVCGTKQSLEMKDFVIPKQGIQSWMVYSQKLSLDDKYCVQSNELIEAPSGPVQEVLMWRNFRTYCKAVGDGIECRDASTLSNMSVENQRVVDGLMESIKLGGAVINL